MADVGEAEFVWYVAVAAVRPLCRVMRYGIWVCTVFLKRLSDSAVVRWAMIHDRPSERPFD